MKQATCGSGGAWIRWFLGVAAAAAVGLAAAPAMAQAASTDDRGRRSDTEVRRDPRDRLFSLDGSLTMGGYNPQGRGWDAAGYVGASFLYRPSLLALGVSGEMGGVIFGPDQQFVGALGGVSADVTPWLRVDALAEFGAHFEQPGQGLELFGTRRVTHGEMNEVVPYAGLRVMPTFLIGRENSFIIGPWAQFRQDLMRAQLDYAVEGCSSFFSESVTCSTYDETSRVGGSLLAAGIRIGGQFGYR